MRREYEVRNYRPGDEEGIVKLLELVFNGWPHLDLKCTPLDYWRWKHLDNPFKGSIVAVGVSDYRIIGVNHRLPMRIKIGDNIYPSLQGVDLAVHPDFRRIGVRTKMREKQSEATISAGIKLHLQVTRNPIVVESLIRMRIPRFPKTVTNLVRIKDFKLQLKAIPVEKARLMKLGFYVAKLFNRVRNAFRESKVSDLRLQISKIRSFDDGIDLLWKDISDHYGFIVERRRDYLNWRYCDPRAGDFIVKKAEDEEGCIKGYSVLKINRYREDYPIGYIVDILTPLDRLHVADTLVADAVRYFDDNDINIVNTLVVKNHPYERIFNRYGFINSRIKPQIFLREHEKVDKPYKLETFSPAQVYFSYGDIDALPVEMHRDL